MKRLIIINLLLAFMSLAPASTNFTTINSSVDLSSTHTFTTNDSLIWWQKCNDNLCDDNSIVIGLKSDGDNFLNLFDDGTFGSVQIQDDENTDAPFLDLLGQWGTDWSCVALINDGGTHRLYFNGVLQDSQADAGTWRIANIGHGHTSTTLNFDGLLAHMGLFDEHILTVDEINQWCRCPGSITKGLVWYFPLWDSGNKVDISGQNVTSTLTSTATSEDGPPISTCGKAQ